MNKAHWCGFIGVVLLLINGSVFAQNESQGSGTIRELTGSVELKFAGSADYVAAKAGDRVRADTIISTGFKSTALVEAGSALIAVRPLTRMTLTEIQTSAGTETINVNLQTGRVKVDLNPPAGAQASMSVNSPSATASVRGTSFDFDTRSLRVYEGKVGFAGKRGQMMFVGAGSDSRVEADGKAADPIVMKTAGLLPPSPPGSDASARPGRVVTVSEPSAPSGGTTIKIGIHY